MSKWMNNWAVLDTAQVLRITSFLLDYKLQAVEVGAKRCRKVRTTALEMTLNTLTIPLAL